MFHLINTSFSEIDNRISSELYQLRKKTFKDRLQWEVKCSNNMEHDEFDNNDTQYVLGICHGEIICSMRFIELDKPNMITHTFGELFNDVSLPLNQVECSRFFVDKYRAQRFLGESYTVSDALFLAMINYGRDKHYDSIYAIVSKSMYAILRRTGWKIELIKEAQLKADENIYLLKLPTDSDSQALFAEKVGKNLSLFPQALFNWPFSLPVNDPR